MGQGNGFGGAVYDAYAATLAPFFVYYNSSLCKNPNAATTLLLI